MEFLIGGGTDELDLAAGQHRSGTDLERHPRCRTSPTMVWSFSFLRMAVPSLCQLLQQVLEKRSKIAPVLVPATRLAISSARWSACPARYGAPAPTMRWAVPRANDRSCPHPAPPPDRVVLLAAHRISPCGPAPHPGRTASVLRPARGSGQVLAILPYRWHGLPAASGRHPRLSRKAFFPDNWRDSCGLLRTGIPMEKPAAARRSHHPQMAQSRCSAPLHGCALIIA